LKADRIHAKLAALRSKLASASGVRPKLLLLPGMLTKKHYITINPTHILMEFTILCLLTLAGCCSLAQGFDRLKEDFSHLC